MFRLTRLTPFEDVFNFQREVDRYVNQFWSDLPSRTAGGPSSSFHVTATDEGWRIDVPMPGVDPKDVSIEAAGTTLSIRAEESGDDKAQTPRYEQTLTIPQFLDLDKLTASHKHGMLRLTLPLKDSIKPRRIQIESQAENGRQLVGVK
jgi:HSP20 family protein